MDSRECIPDEVFDIELDKATKENCIKVLSHFVSLLATEVINTENCFGVLKWAYDLVAIDPMHLTMELCNVLTSVKKKTSGQG